MRALLEYIVIWPGGLSKPEKSQLLFPNSVCVLKNCCKARAKHEGGAGAEEVTVLSLFGQNRPVTLLLHLL